MLPGASFCGFSLSFHCGPTSPQLCISTRVLNISICRSFSKRPGPKRKPRNWTGKQWSHHLCKYTGVFLACVYIHANTCMFWWRPEVYFNHSSFFFFKAEFLISLELASSTRLWPDSPTGPPVSASSTQGLQMEAASPSFPWGLWGIELMPLSLCSNRFMDSHLSRPLWLFVCFRSGFFFLVLINAAILNLAAAHTLWISMKQRHEEMNQDIRKERRLSVLSLESARMHEGFSKMGNQITHQYWQRKNKRAILLNQDLRNSISWHSQQRWKRAVSQGKSFSFLLPGEKIHWEGDVFFFF